MAEYRTVKKGAYRDEFMLDLEPKDKLLYLWLFTNDYINAAGIMPYNPKVIEFETEMKSKDLDKFIENGKVVGDRGLLFIRNFVANQFKAINDRLKEGISRCLDGCSSKLILYEFGTTYPIIPYPYPIDRPGNGEIYPIQVPLNLLTSKPLNLDTLNTYDQNEFDRFWKSYPRKVGKQRCMRWFKLKKPGNVDGMIHTIEAFLNSGEWSDPQYVPHPFTWLNRGGWDDETSKIKSSPEDLEHVRQLARM